MATMYVSYGAGVEKGVIKSPAGSTSFTTSGTSAKTAAAPPLNAGIAVVFSDTAHYVAVGPYSSVTAAASNGIYVPANQQREIALNPGDGVAAITV